MWSVIYQLLVENDVVDRLAEDVDAGDLSSCDDVYEDTVCVVACVVEVDGLEVERERDFGAADGDGRDRVWVVYSAVRMEVHCGKCCVSNVKRSRQSGGQNEDPTKESKT